MNSQTALAIAIIELRRRRMGVDRRITVDQAARDERNAALDKLSDAIDTLTALREMLADGVVPIRR